MLKILITLFLVITISVDLTLCACKIHDAKWINIMPIVTQPSRSQPDKVKIDWKRSIQNARCVDSYNIYAWKLGQPREKGQKIPISDKNATTAELTIEPCVDYNFAVEFIEKDWTHTDVESSNQAKFKTEAIPSFLDNNPGNFHVSYAYDNIKKSQVLNKATIKFPKRIIKHASCIKHIEINGEPDNTIGGSSTFGRSMTFGQRIQAENFIWNNPGSSSFNPGRTPGGSSYNPGTNPGYTIGGSNHHPGGTPGGSSYTPGRNPGGSSYTPGNNPGGSSFNPGNNPGGSSYNPGSGSDFSDWSQHPTWNQSPDHILPDNWGQHQNPNCPPGGSSMSHDRNYDPNCYWSRQAYDHNHVFGEGNHGTGRPIFNQNHQRTKRAVTTSRPPLGMVNAKATPPFFNDVIEVTFPIQPCQPYNFKIKIVTPRNSVLGEVKDIKLPKLSQMTDFHPPRLSKMFKVETVPSLKLSLNAGFDIPATCMSEFLEAVDNHMHHLEEDIKFHIEEEKRAYQQTHQVYQTFNNHKKLQMNARGCTCESTYISVNGTAKSGYQNFMGIYHFEGMNQGKAYFIQVDIANPNHKGFLYFDPNKGIWNIGSTLMGSNDIKFKTDKFAKPDCPADTGNLKQWQYSGTLGWKNDPTLTITCLQQ